MAPNRTGGASRNGVERVRHELLTALHFGKLGPGDRVPSVRRLADTTGMNRKTIHRAYRRLADEGLLELRPGSGTFIAERIVGNGSNGGPASVGDLLLAVNRCRATAETLGLSPDVFASFLDIQLASGFRDVPVVVTECNHEQLGLMEQELSHSLGLDTRPKLIEDLKRAPAASLEGAVGVITTECHGAEVDELVASSGLPVFRVALDPHFPQRVVDQARGGRMLMVVKDRTFAPVFRRLLEQMAVPAELIRRIDIHETREARARLWDLDADSTLWVSPLVESAWRHLPAGRYRRLSCTWRVESASAERLRAGLALCLAQRRRPVPKSQPVPAPGFNVHPS